MENHLNNFGAKVHNNGCFRFTLIFIFVQFQNVGAVDLLPQITISETATTKYQSLN